MGFFSEKLAATTVEVPAVVASALSLIRRYLPFRPPNVKGKQQRLGKQIRE
jgi:hypothetical protein